MIKLKKAWNNVKSLAETSNYYKTDNDDADIALIEDQINKEKPIKPAVNNGIYYCYRCGRGCGYIDDKMPNYCMWCGQKL